MASDPEQRGLKVLVVDDSAVYRKILKEVVGEIAGATLVGTAPNGRIALDKVRMSKPDLVLLDVEMPEMNGLETLERLRSEASEVCVVMVSGIGKQAIDVTVAALERGAVDFVTKPEGASPESNRRSLVELLAPIIMNVATKLAVAKVKRHHDAISDRVSRAPKLPAEEVSPREARRAPQAPGQPFEVVTVGISTGGPNALGVLVPSLPRDLGVPVLIVQHMPPVFTASLAASLNGKARLPVVEAADGALIEPGRVYIAPGGYHMVVRRRGEDSRPAIGLNENPPENSCRPAVDVLFRSVAAVYRGRALSVVMTGMGRDGLSGVRTLKQRGAYCITQDEATSTIYGMPGAVFNAGLADESVPLGEIGERIAVLVRNRSGRSLTSDVH